MNIHSGLVESILIVIIVSITDGTDSVSRSEDDFKIGKLVPLVDDINVMNSTIINNLRRMKRQSSGKFEEASEMGTLKLARVIVQMIRNLWVKNTVGGTCPWHESVPKPVVLLFKERIGQMLAPPKSKNEIEEEGR